MENREITLADIFLDVLSKSQDKGAKLMTERIKAAVKSPEILELVNICVINALGFKSKISSKTVDDAIDGIISFVHAEIDSSSLSDDDKEKEKNSYKQYAKSLGKMLKENLRVLGSPEKNFVDNRHANLFHINGKVETQNIPNCSAWRPFQFLNRIFRLSFPLSCFFTANDSNLISFRRQTKALCTD